MTAQPQSRPMSGHMSPQPAAPSSVAPAREQPAAPRTRGSSRNATIALALSVLVAIGGVSFALGRMSVDEAASGAASPFAAGTSSFASAATSDAAGESTASSTGPGPGEPTVAAVAAVDDADAASELESDPVAEADEPPALPDEQRGQRPASAPGTGLGGAQGSVAEITTEYLTVTADDGSTLTFAVDSTTSWVRQEAIDAADVQPGDAVIVQIPFAGPGADASDDSTSAVATQVTATKPAA